MARRILIADDDEGIRELLRTVLAADGYEVVAVSDGKKALESVLSLQPDAVVLDVDLPFVNGFEVLEKMRENPATKLTPVILLTIHAAVKDRVTGLKLGADDYMPKPFSPPELLARLEALFRRVEQMKATNPLTGLPGNNAIEEEVTRRIREGSKFAVLYTDIDNFKAYNDVYGFSRGDDVIGLTASILLQKVKLCGNGNDLVGHIGGDDFVVITTPEKVDAICQEVIAEFDSKVPMLYGEEDRARGFIVARNRQGVEQAFPLMALSIGVVTNERRPIQHFAELAQLAAEVKHAARTRKQSTYFKDRRLG